MLMTTDLVNMLMPTVKMEDDRQLAAEAPTQYYDSTLLNLADNAGRMLDGAMIGPSLTDAAGTGIKAVGAVPDGTELNILGGVLTQEPGALKDLDVAKKLWQSGRTPLEVETQTGWIPDADGNWKREVTPEDVDYGMPLIAAQDYIRQQKATGQPIYRQDFPLGTLIKHKNLFRDYPQVADVPVQIYYDPADMYGGMYQASRNLSTPQAQQAFPKGVISINAAQRRDPASMWKVLEHETQHLIDELHSQAGYSHELGGNSDDIESEIEKALGTSADGVRQRYYQWRDGGETDFVNLYSALAQELRSKRHQIDGGYSWTQDPKFLAEFELDKLDLQKLRRFNHEYPHRIGLPENAQYLDIIRSFGQRYNVPIDRIERIASTAQDQETLRNRLNRITPYWDKNEYSPFDLYQSLIGETNARTAEDLATTSAMDKFQTPFVIRREARITPHGLSQPFDPRLLPSELFRARLPPR